MLESQFGACGVRISRLKANGQPDYGNVKGALTIVGGISKFTHGFDVQKGVDLYETDACGQPVVTYKLPDQTKWATFKLTLAKNDDRMYEITGLGDLLGLGVAGAHPSGFTVKAARGCSPTPPPQVCLELWSNRVYCDTIATDYPLKRVILPGCILTPSGFDRVAKTALPDFDGIVQVNNNFQDGPFSDLQELVGETDWVYSEVVDSVLPQMPSPFDYVPVPAHHS